MEFPVRPPHPHFSLSGGIGLMASPRYVYVNHVMRSFFLATSYLLTQQIFDELLPRMV
jgi:hypothetical protein